MAELQVTLVPEPGGSCRVTARCDGREWTHLAPPEDVARLRESAGSLMDVFGAGTRPLVDPVALAELGAQLRDAFLAPVYADADTPITATGGCILFTSTSPDYLNLPWELLPRPGGDFLVADARWSIRRTTRDALPAATATPLAGPLRILFTSCAPRDLNGLDYEREEEAMLAIANRLGGKVHLDIAEAGTFEDLSNLITEHNPHVVHLSGHGVLSDGVGHFAFENERGGSDLRDAIDMADQLFAGRDVRLVFVSGCESAQAGVAGVCQALTASDHVPIALGWGASIADDHATEFGRVFYHELAAGRSVDAAVGVARADLYIRCRVRFADGEALDPSFALPQIYAAEAVNTLVDPSRAEDRPDHPGVQYMLLGDNIRGLREGFVGRRRLLQRTRPALRTGEKTVLLLTGIGGAGKSTTATRLANRFKLDGFQIAAVQARRGQEAQFCMRLLGEIAVACQRLGRNGDEAILRDGQRPIEDRLRLAVEILNEAPILLVLDNLESLMPKPPAEPRWPEDFGGFFAELTSRLTGEGRAILTCRYVPQGFDVDQPNLAHEPLPDFSEAEFFKYLSRHKQVSARIDRGELDPNLLTLFHRKLGATPRFVEQACAVLATIALDKLQRQLEGVEDPPEAADPGEIGRLQQKYFQDLFLPELYDALSPDLRLALSRFALVEIPLPLDGLARVSGLDEPAAENAAARWIGLGLLQRFGETDEVPLFAVYPLQREFLTNPQHLDEASAREAHQAAAAFFQECFEKDRVSELRLSFELELLACLQHAVAAGDRERRRWAAVRLSNGWLQRAEFTTVFALLNPFLAEDRHPSILRASADALVPLGNWEEARSRYEEALGAFRSIGDRAGEAGTWHQLATLDLREGNYESARRKFAKSLAIKQSDRDLEGEAATWLQLGCIEMAERNYPLARQHYEKARSMCQMIGYRAGEATAWHQLGSIDLNDGNYGGAREKFGESLAIRTCQPFRDRMAEAATWAELGRVEMAECNYSLARQHYMNARDMLQATGDVMGEAGTLHQVGVMAWKNSRQEVGIRLVSISVVLFAEIGAAERERVAKNLSGMADKLGLDDAGLEKVMREAAEHYQRDRAASLVRDAFEGL